MTRTRDESARATFSVTCRYCTRVIVENVPILDDTGTQTLRAHFAACYENVTPCAALGDLLVHFSVRDGVAQTDRAKSD